MIILDLRGRVLLLVAIDTLYNVPACFPASPTRHTYDSYGDIDSYNDIDSYDDIGGYNDIDSSEERSRSLCTVPDHPKHGRYWSVGPMHLHPGASLPLLFLNTTCDAGHMAVGGDHGVFVCYNGNWSSKQFPTCTRTCRLEQSPSMKFRCIITEFSNSEGTRDCNEFEPEGTIVQPNCRRPTHYSPTELPYMHCRGDGSWSYTPRCEPECGRLTTGGVPLIVGGHDAQLGSVPWAVGIYNHDGKSWNLIGSGNLVSRNLIVTAAHDCWDTKSGQQKPATRFAVVAGKRHGDWQHPLDDASVQRSRVKSIHMPTSFYGADLYYQDDLAVLVLEVPFEYTQHVGPVCVNFAEDLIARQLRPGNVGVCRDNIKTTSPLTAKKNGGPAHQLFGWDGTSNFSETVGWGQTSGLRDSRADTLQMLEMPYVTFEECIKRTPAYFRNFLVGGKICAGYGNGTAPSRGDSGGGLVFAEETLGVTRYYLQAVISTSPISRDGRIDLDALTSFEPIAKHEKLIKEHWDPYM